MTKRKIIDAMPLCSRCTNTEITSWLEDNLNNMSNEVKKQIVQELKAIKLKPGECLVCNAGLVSDKTQFNILNILKDNKINEKIVEEFEKDFCLIEED